MVESFKGQAYIPEEIRKLEDSLCDQYLCNFSVFQSLIDHWALGHLFPIMPLSRLNERPTREATLVDITCDSDGQVNKFIDLRDVRDTLALHALNRKNGNGLVEPYYLGFFLMGAYQDIMGDLTISSTASMKCMSSSTRTSLPAITSRKSSKARPSCRRWPGAIRRKTN